MVTEIVSDGFDVESFVLRSEGQDYTIYLYDKRDYGFPLVGYLNTRRIKRQPICIDLEERRDRLYAEAIFDVCVTELG